MIVQIELTAYEALEFTKWKSKMIDSVNAPYDNSIKITNVINKIDDQLVSQLLKGKTVENFKYSYAQDLLTTKNI